MPVTRGSWNLHQAIDSRWQSRNLDGRFREAWGALRNTDKFLTLNDTEARAAKGSPHPTPYCVMEIGDPIIQSHSCGRAQTAAETITDPLAANGARDTERQIVDITVQFRVYAGKKRTAIQYAKLVAEAFDKSRLELEDDEHIETFRDGDFSVRESDSTWSWMLIYRFRIDCAYAAEHS